MTCMLGDVGNPDIRRRNTSKHWRQPAEAAEPKDIYKKSMHEEGNAHLVGIQDDSDNSDPDYNDKSGEPVYACRHTWYVHQPGEQEETSHPISHQHADLQKVREPVQDPLSYCSAKGQHWDGCKPTQLINLRQDNW